MPVGLIFALSNNLVLGMSVRVRATFIGKKGSFASQGESSGPVGSPATWWLIPQEQGCLAVLQARAQAQGRNPDSAHLGQDDQVEFL